jgi:hypothetical protein
LDFYDQIIKIKKGTQYQPGICHMNQNILTPVVIILARVDLDRFDANCRQDFYGHIFLK